MAKKLGAENPISLKELNSLKITEELRSFVNDLSSDIEEELTNRAHWEQRIDVLRNLRYGIRRQKNHPWPRSANFNIPLMDSDIEESKPGYMNLLNATPIVNYVKYGAEDQEPARRKEQLNDWRLRTQVKFTEQYGYGVDRLLEQGATVFKTSWKFRTVRYTKQFDIVDFDDATKNALYDTRVDDDLLFVYYSRRVWR